MTQERNSKEAIQFPKYQCLELTKIVEHAICHHGRLQIPRYIQFVLLFSSKDEKDWVKGLFYLLDSDGDGYLSQHDLEILLRVAKGFSSGHEPLQRTDIKTFSQSEANQHGKISFTEFQRLQARAINMRSLRDIILFRKKID